MSSLNIKVLIADKLPEHAAERLQTAGATVVHQPLLKGDELTQALANISPDVVIVRSTKFTSADFDAATQLKLVVRAGAGVNNIDLAAASTRAVSVANCPGMNAVAVAELTWGHILNADRRIADNVRDLRAQLWRKKEYAKASGLKGRRIGVIGCGAIARAVIKRAHAFEMNVGCCAPELDEKLAQELGVQQFSSPVDMAKQVSILTVHVPLMDSTRGLIGSDVFEALPPNAIVINTSRGGILDETALAQAVQAKGIRAGLDVFDNEPPADGDWATPTATLEGVYGTHHIGASTTQAQDAVAVAACETVIHWAQTGNVRHCVNMQKQSSADAHLIIRHHDQVGVLATVLDILRCAGLNVQGMENEIFSGPNAAACARIQIQGKVTQSLLDELQTVPELISLQAVML